MKYLTLYLFLSSCYFTSALSLRHYKAKNNNNNNRKHHKLNPRNHRDQFKHEKQAVDPKKFCQPNQNYSDFVAQAEASGFFSCEHKVLTNDGYILKLFQIYSPACQQHNSNSVLLLHGMLMNSDSFLVAGPKAGLPYLLARDCFIVYVGNHRGTNNGRGHLYLNPDKDPAFWNYTVTELGTDVKAMIDYVHTASDGTKADVIGFSTGAAAFIAALSSDSKYNEKVNRAIILAPTKNFHFIKSSFLWTIMFTINTFKGLLDFFKIYEVLYKGSCLQTFLAKMCKSVFFTRKLCLMPLTGLINTDALQEETLTSLYNVMLMGVSTQLISHFVQMSQSNKFRKYDFGTTINKLEYNQSTPPDYDTSKVLVPVTIIASSTDAVATFGEINTYTKEIRYSKLFVLPNPSWNHLDFIFNSGLDLDVYPFVREALLEDWIISQFQ